MVLSINKFLLFALLLVPIISVFERHEKLCTYAEDEVDEDIVEDEDEEETIVDEGTKGSDVEEGENLDEGDPGPQGSPDADTVMLFIQPTGDSITELPAGKLVEFLVGFTNNGDQDFYLESIDASFRYPMDFNFFIQNFTGMEYKKIVKPRQEATVMYSFFPAEAFAGRPLGLCVNLAYHGMQDGETFIEAVFNQTVTITEVDEGLDGETFFLYLFLLALAVLLLLAGHHFLSTFGKRKVTVKKATVEMGTTSKDGIDYDWIPKEYLEEFKAKQSAKAQQNGKAGNRTSPRNRTNAKVATSPKKTSTTSPKKTSTTPKKVR